MDFGEDVIRRSVVFRQYQRETEKIIKQLKKTIDKQKQYSRKRKDYFSTSRKLQFTFKKELLESLSRSCQMANSVNLQIDKVIISQKEITENNKKIDIVITKKTENNQANDLSKATYIKDKSNTSDKTYQSWKTNLHLKSLPSLRRIYQKKRKLNRIIAINENEYGYYCSIKRKFTLILESLIKKKKVKIIDNKIAIKLGGDGTNICRGKKVLNISFCILNEDRCNTASGTYLIGVFMINDENYENVNICLKEIKQDFSLLNTIKIRNEVYTIEKFVGGDWKFLAIVRGIKAANSKFPCIYCHSERHEATYKNYEEISCSINNKYGNNRTLDKALKCVEAGKEEYGYVKTPIFDFIEFNRSVPDLLHLFLRITGKISKLFFRNCQEHNTEYASNYIGFLQDICGIHGALEENTGQQKLRDLMGDEYNRLRDNIELLNDGFKGMAKLDHLMNIWRLFFDIIDKVKRNELDAIEMKNETLNWLGVFLKVHSNKEVTPYMHAFVYHLYEFQESLGKLNLTINKFNLQGLEKKNDIVTSQYFRSTNRNIFKSLKYILLKNNRLDLLSIDFD